MIKRLICPACRNVVREESGRLACDTCGVSYAIINDVPSMISEHNNSENSAYKKETADFLQKMEERHFWHKERKKIIYQIAKGLLKYSPGNAMLELGCGNGNVLQYLLEKGISMDGADMSMESLQNCRRKTGAALYHVDAYRTPFEDESYGAVGLFDVMEHVKNDGLLLKETFRICKKGGFVIITVPAYQGLWSYFDRLAQHERRYEKSELIAILEKSGFTIRRISFFMMAALPAVWIMRRLISKNVQNDRGFDSPDLRTVPIVNGTFSILCFFERLLLKLTDLPFGTSLICVAQK